MSKSVSPPPSPKVFISYRRDDSAGHAGRLYDRLSAHFGEDQIFMDIEQIEAGVDFVRAIQDAVGSCEILVVLIGKNWLASRDEAGRRLDNPNDFVRLEIAAALERDVRVIPVLVHGATMPRPQDLPEDMLALSRRNAIELSDTRWKYDVDGLIAALEKVLDRQREAQRRSEEAAAERQRLETEARQREAAEAQRREAGAGETQRREAEEPPEVKGAAHLGTAGEVKEAALHEDQEERRTQEKEGQADRRIDERMEDERRGRRRQGQAVREEVGRKQKAGAAAGQKIGLAKFLAVPVVVVLLFILTFTFWPKHTIPPAPTVNIPAFLFCYQQTDGPPEKNGYNVVCFTSQALCENHRAINSNANKSACARVDMSQVSWTPFLGGNRDGTSWFALRIGEPFGEPFPQIRK